MKNSARGELVEPCELCGSVVSPFLNVWNDWNLLNDWNPRKAVIFCFNECIANVAVASMASL
jgi:hypothetical protein